MKSFLEYLFEAKRKAAAVDPEKTIHEFLTAIVLVNKDLLDIKILDSENFKDFYEKIENKKINLKNIKIGKNLSNRSINSYKKHFLNNAYKTYKKGAQKIQKIDKNIFGVLARAISAA